MGVKKTGQLILDKNPKAIQWENIIFQQMCWTVGNLYVKRTPQVQFRKDLLQEWTVGSVVWGFWTFM
jgi:hypothetical protein